MRILFIDGFDTIICETPKAIVLVCKCMRRREARRAGPSSHGFTTHVP